GFSGKSDGKYSLTAKELSAAKPQPNKRAERPPLTSPPFAGERREGASRVLYMAFHRVMSARRYLRKPRKIFGIAIQSSQRLKFFVCYAFFAVVSLLSPLLSATITPLPGKASR